jgi:hypothetical protein
MRPLTPLRALAATTLIALAPSLGMGQQPTVVRTSGSVLRYLGDTLWSERDTTVLRSIFHGDTIKQAQLVDGRLRYDVTYVVRGDSGRVVSAINPDSIPPLYQTPSLELLLADRTYLAAMIPRAESQARMQARGNSMPERVPLSPPDPITYAVSPTLSIVQHRDTARYLRAARGRIDTTIYLFTGDTMVRRISPVPRTFGLAMNVTIVSDMRLAAQRVAPRIPPPALPAATPIVVPLTVGGVYRAHGDTIWFDRDSSSQISIYRGDTVTRMSLVNGRLATRQVWHVQGDSARSIAFIDSTRSHTEQHAATAASLDVRPMFVMMLQIEAMTKQADALVKNLVVSSGGRLAGRVAPTSPAMPTAYCVNAGLAVIQHGDTARYVHARPTGADTSAFVFTSDTTVQRISPAPRAFGLAMTATIRGDVQRAIVRRSNEARNSALVATLPGGHLKLACYGK